jgi:hypothetical protein
MAQLTRDRDGEGYHGSRVEIIDPETQAVEFFDGDSSKLIGKMLLVGTMTAGMFTTRDWWRTNVITEILSGGDGEIRFTTESGSKYTLKR